MEKATNKLYCFHGSDSNISELPILEEKGESFAIIKVPNAKTGVMEEAAVTIGAQFFRSAQECIDTEKTRVETIVRSATKKSSSLQETVRLS